MILERNFLISELHGIEDFVFKKMKVPDLYRLRDRFEGNAFLENTKYKVITINTILNFIDPERIIYREIGFISSMDFYNVVEIKRIERFQEFELLSGDKENFVYTFVDFKLKVCNIKLSDETLGLILEHLIFYNEKRKKLL